MTRVNVRTTSPGRRGARLSLLPRVMSARKAWVAAARAREAAQSIIVDAFERNIAGAGPGPTDFDLQLFARLAVSERRLKRAFSRARVLSPCAGAPTLSNRKALPERGKPP